MMMSYASVPTMEGLREASDRWARRERARVRLASGAAVLDALLGGGWPGGKVGEQVEPHNSGRTGVAAATIAAATARGEVVAWLDAADAFDPTSAAAAGVDLRRVLWVRPHGVEETVRAAELVLETGGFTILVLDLGGAAAAVQSRARGGRGALRLRLARAVERAGAVALVLAGRPWVGTLAGATVVLGRGTARWGGERSRWLDGIALRARVQRGGVRHDPNVRAALAAARGSSGEGVRSAGGGKPRPYIGEAGAEAALGA